MLTATEFMYDGVHSGKYGLQIASFDDGGGGTSETPYVTHTVSAEKPPLSHKYFYTDVSLDSPPTYDFTLVSEMPICEEVLRDILRWLDARHGFRELVLMQPEYDGLKYKCVFTVSGLIYHMGACIGINVSATFDSEYCYGSPTIVKFTGDGTEKNIRFVNHSDIPDAYVYPVVEFTADDGSVSITNISDDTSRVFSFDDLTPKKSYVVDNELKVITGDGATLLSKFSKRWLRLRSGLNMLKIKIKGTVKITCPQYVKISF